MSDNTKATAECYGVLGDASICANHLGGKMTSAGVCTAKYATVDTNGERCACSCHEGAKCCRCLSSPMSRLSNLLARIHRDGGHYEAEYGTGKAVHDADVIIADLNAERDERQATEATLSDHDLSLIEERCGFGVYERVQRLCGIENRAHTVLNSDISGQQSNLTATYILTGEGKKYVC